MKKQITWDDIPKPIKDVLYEGGVVVTKGNISSLVIQIDLRNLLKACNDIKYNA